MSHYLKGDIFMQSDTTIGHLNRITELIEHQYANATEHRWHFVPPQPFVAAYCIVSPHSLC